ncbi:MAG: hypothetical protein KDB94_11230 [Acidobacteria bacterium]|nr:hypothetical protein [Acidobacteriota bacterium]
MRSKGAGFRWLGLACGLLVLAIAAERLEWAGALRSWGQPERDFYWLAGDPRDPRPVAFFAVRDFGLRERPESAVAEVLGDQDYILSVNGERVGSNRYRAGADLDRYEVARWLRPGENRIVLELRSATAAGGYSFRLADGQGRDLLAEAPPWQVHKSYFRALFPGGTAPPAPEAALVGHAPVGRWGLPRPGPIRPTFEDLLAVPRVVPAVRYRQDSSAWHRLRTKGRRRESLGPRVEFDFGAPVTGYLQLEVRGREAATGLLRFSLSPGIAEPGPIHALATMIPQRGLWQDAVVRRFRYVDVLGLDGVTGAGVLPMVDDSLEALGGADESEGLLGLPAPPLRAPVEDVIRRELEGDAGLALGESR